jgi:integrase
MARLIKPLTTAQVGNARPRAAKYKMFDGGGLFLQVNPSGGKYWKMKYRKDDGKEGLLSFGSFPAVSLEQARRMRDEARARKAAGLDPGEARRREKAARAERAKNTFEAVARDWLEVHSTKVTPQTLHNYRRALEKFVFPLVGRTPVRDLKAPDFLEVLRRMEASGQLHASKQANIMCSMVMRHAVSTGLADMDPLPSLRGSLKSYKKKHFAALTDPGDVGRLLRVIWGHSCNFVVSCALKILPYVFVRPGELRHAQWADIDFESCEWRYTVPKTGAPHIVPLAPQVLEILQDLHGMTGQGLWVFPSLRSTGNPIGKGTLIAAFRYMGVGGDAMTAHGFRATARTLLDEVLKERVELIEQQLSHKLRDPGGRAYNRTVHLDERKRMMTRWADYLDSLRTQAGLVEPAANKRPAPQGAGCNAGKMRWAPSSSDSRARVLTR